MLKKPTPAQQELEMVTLEMLVPKEHLLRKIDAVVDFEFIREKVAHLYAPYLDVSEREQREAVADIDPGE